MREKTVDLGTIRIHYAEGPVHGPPLLLLHGGSACWQSWGPLLPALTASFHAYALDLRGHGRSDWQRPYYLAAYADDIVAFLRTVAEPAILCGHSLGGMVALLAAAAAGPAIRGVIVGDAPLSATTWLAELAAIRPRLETWHALARTYRDPAPLAVALRESLVEVPGHDRPLPARAVFGDDSPWFSWMAGNLARLDPASLAVLLEEPERAAAGYEVDLVLPAITAPVCLLQADPAVGAMITDAEVAAAQRATAQMYHEQLIGVSHALHATHPEEVSAAIERCWAAILAANAAQRQ